MTKLTRLVASGCGVHLEGTLTGCDYPCQSTRPSIEQMHSILSLKYIVHPSCENVLLDRVSLIQTSRRRPEDLELQYLKVGRDVLEFYSGINFGNVGLLA